jgi:tetratricopeptide (TPR) repeat protein
MTWIGWILVTVALALVVIVLQGAFQVVASLVDRYTGERRSRSQAHEAMAHRPSDAKSTALASMHAPELAPPAERTTVRAIHNGHAAEIKKPSFFAWLLKMFKIASAGKRYDHWVSLAIAERDLATKVKYLAKALELDPTYIPGWGLKASALCELNRFEEAIACFDKLIELQPSAFVWYHKADCCHRLERHDDALRSVNKALAVCSKQDAQLYEQILHLRQVLHDESHGKGAA